MQAQCNGQTGVDRNIQGNPNDSVVNQAKSQSQANR